MALRALRRHRHLPAAAALIGAILYAYLAASHIVSQATYAGSSASGAEIQAEVQTALVSPDCHDALPSAGKETNPGRGHPARAPSKCPFCVGYAALNFAVIGSSANVLLPEALPQPFESFGGAQLAGSANSSPWHARAPPS